MSGIRIARAADAPAVVKVVNAAFQAEKFFIEGDRVSLDHVSGLFAKGDFLVAEDDGGLAGCVYVEHRGERAYLGLLSVDPPRQGAGVGKQLMAAAEEHARRQGCNAIDLRIVNLRRELPSFYKKLGYIERGIDPFPEDVPTKLPCHFVNMTKELRPAATEPSGT